MRYLAPITMLILALAITQPVVAQSSEPDDAAGWNAYFEKDYATALKHFRSLAKQGDAVAQNMLGEMYREGQGVPKNYKEAVRWYREATKLGNIGAQRNLGRMYRDGRGVLQDLVMAYVWINLATNNGCLLANERRDEIHAKLTAPERKQALKLSKLCLRKPAKCPEYSAD